MEIIFISREEVLNKLLDQINTGIKIDDEVKQLLIDFVKKE